VAGSETLYPVIVKVWPEARLSATPPKEKGSGPNSLIRVHVSRTTKLVSQDISICEHFHSICMPRSLFSISVWCKSILGYGGFTPMHIWLL